MLEDGHWQEVNGDPKSPDTVVFGYALPVIANGNFHLSVFN